MNTFNQNGEQMTKQQNDQIINFQQSQDSNIEMVNKIINSFQLKILEERLENSNQKLVNLYYKQVLEKNTVDQLENHLHQQIDIECQFKREIYKLFLDFQSSIKNPQHLISNLNDRNQQKQCNTKQNIFQGFLKNLKHWICCLDNKTQFIQRIQTPLLGHQDNGSIILLLDDTQKNMFLETMINSFVDSIDILVNLIQKQQKLYLIEMNKNQKLQIVCDSDCEKIKNLELQIIKMQQQEGILKTEYRQSIEQITLSQKDYNTVILEQQDILQTEQKTKIQNQKEIMELKSKVNSLIFEIKELQNEKDYFQKLFELQKQNLETEQQKNHKQVIQLQDNNKQLYKKLMNLENKLKADDQQQNYSKFSHNPIAQTQILKENPSVSNKTEQIQDQYQQQPQIFQAQRLDDKAEKVVQGEQDLKWQNIEEGKTSCQKQNNNSKENTLRTQKNFEEKQVRGQTSSNDNGQEFLVKQIENELH